MNTLVRLSAIFSVLLSCTFAQSSTSEKSCDDQVPMERYMMDASSRFKDDVKPAANGLMNWAAIMPDEDQWIEAGCPIGGKMEVTAVITQGRYWEGIPQFVTSYTIEYTENGFDFIPYEEDGEIKVFEGNTDADTVVTQTLSPSIIANAVRIRPKTWENWVAMRIGFKGCKVKKACKDIPNMADECKKFKEEDLCYRLPKMAYHCCPKTCEFCPEEEEGGDLGLGSLFMRKSNMRQRELARKRNDRKRELAKKRDIRVNSN